LESNPQNWETFLQKNEEMMVCYYLHQNTEKDRVDKSRKRQKNHVSLKVKKKKITCFSNCYYSYICNIFFFSFPKQIQLTKWVFLFVHEIHGQKIAKISFDLHYAKDLFCHFYKNSKYDTVKKTDWLNRS
jgi:endonuclease III-like uncharacterized protein